MSKAKCELCFKTLATKQELRDHIKRMHQKKKDHKCDSCDKSFMYSKELRRHINGFHLKILKNRCQYCQKDIGGLPSALTKHILTVHEGKKLFKCDLCFKGFSTKDAVTNHMRAFHNIEDVTLSDENKVIHSS